MKVHMEGWRAGGGSKKREGWRSATFESIQFGRWVSLSLAADSSGVENYVVKSLSLNTSDWFLYYLYPVVPVLLVSRPCEREQADDAETKAD